MKYPVALLSGTAGAVVLTGVHQILKNNVSNAPRMDKMGKQALTGIIRATGRTVPSEDKVYKAAMAADLVSNSMYYSLVGAFKGKELITGVALGLAAGIGAVVLPDKLGLNNGYSDATPRTQALTVGIYVLGGLVAGLIQHYVSKENKIAKSSKDYRKLLATDFNNPKA